MKNLIVVGLFVVMNCSATGCVSGPYARQGATMGALIGAPVGAAIGSRNGETAAGALLGGTFGALAGSNIGAGIDAEQQALQRQDEINRQFPPGGLGLQDVMAMSQSGLGEEVIMAQIRNQGMRQGLSPGDLIALKQAGVSDRVVQAMQASQIRSVPAMSPRGSGPIIVEEHYWNSGYDPYCGPYPARYYRGHRPIRRGRRASFSFSHRF